jgi:seryl-tRNA synthetase
MKTTSKRRRTRVEIQETNRRDQVKAQAIEAKLKRLADLEQEHAALQEKVDHSEAVEQQVQGFINQGLLTFDQGGLPQINAEAVLASD